MSGRSLLLLAVSLLLGSTAAAERDSDFMAELVARTFFRALVEGDPTTVAPLCARRVNLDGTWAEGETLLGRLRAISRRSRELGLQLRRVVVIPYTEAVRRYGEPPLRLRQAIARGGRVALARFNTLGAVAVLRRAGAFWKVIAVTD